MRAENFDDAGGGWRGFGSLVEAVPSTLSSCGGPPPNPSRSPVPCVCGDGIDGTSARKAKSSSPSSTSVAMSRSLMPKSSVGPVVETASMVGVVERRPQRPKKRETPVGAAVGSSVGSGAVTDAGGVGMTGVCGLDAIDGAWEVLARADGTWEMLDILPRVDDGLCSGTGVGGCVIGGDLTSSIPPPEVTSGFWAAFFFQKFHRLLGASSTATLPPDSSSPSRLRSPHVPSSPGPKIRPSIRRCCRSGARRKDVDGLAVGRASAAVYR